ncbi:MAG: hypothetical protein HC887_13475 [Desulfobacteraceae bacterium]|nr:hypothetical protein [Desulfobacteraceae bacterium]
MERLDCGIIAAIFLSVLNVLEHGELASRESVNIIESRKADVMAEFADAESAKKLLNAMPPRYLLYTSAEDIADHIRLYLQLGDSPFVWEIRKHENTRQVTFCAKDAPGLISKIAGVFTLNSINILDVQANTWLNRIALDIFEVSPPPDILLEDERWDRAKRDMEAALSGTLNLTGVLKEKLNGSQCMPHTLARPHRIKIDNNSLEFFYDYRSLHL